MAFSPAEAGKPHPAPWSAVNGGLSYDVLIELRIDSSGNPEWLIGTKALWWSVALMRLKSSWTLFIPVFSDHSFQEIPKSKNTRLSPMEIPSRGKSNSLVENVELSIDDLTWIAKNWKKAAFLFHRDRNFAQAFEAYDHSTTTDSPSLGMLILWSALEHLFAPSKQELRFRVCALIACYLKEPGQERIQFHKKLMKLYDERSLAAHTANKADAELTFETFNVMGAVLLKIISDNNVPSREHLEKLLFGAI